MLLIEEYFIYYLITYPSILSPGFVHQPKIYSKNTTDKRCDFMLDLLCL